MLRKALLFLVLITLSTSCVSKKRIVYFQNISEISLKDSVNYEATIKSDDVLMIIVSAPDAEAALPFNLPAISVMGSLNSPIEMAQGQTMQQTYLVDSEGFVQMPILGQVKLGGLTKISAVKKITDEVKRYINNPIINFRIVNFKVSVTGEVNLPTVITLNSERITLPEALAKAGDLTVYGNRHNVLIIRDVDGKKTYNFVDMTKADFINSPFYYLSQNDLVYVEPNKTKINSSAVGPNISIIISAASVVLSVVVALILR